MNTNNMTEYQKKNIEYYREKILEIQRRVVYDMDCVNPSCEYYNALYEIQSGLSAISQVIYNKYLKKITL